MSARQGNLKINLVRSLIGYPQSPARRWPGAWACASPTPWSSGRTRPSIRGMVRKIPHLVEVEVVENMNLSTLKPAKGSRKDRQRVGRGPGSGLGRRRRARAARASCKAPATPASAASRAARCRSSAAFPSAASPTSSGSNTPRSTWTAWPALTGAEIGPAEMAAARLIGSAADRVKILGRGEIARAHDRPGPQVLRLGQGQDREGRRQGRRPRGLTMMLDSIRNIFSIPELRKRVIFTLVLLAIYRAGGQIPNPGHLLRRPGRVLAGPEGDHPGLHRHVLRAATCPR